MSGLPVDWAVLGKEAGSHEEYDVLDCSDPAMFGNFGGIMRKFASGTSDSESLPRTSTSYFLDDSRREMLGLSYQDWSGPVDAFGRRSARTRFVCAPWEEFATRQVSYRALGAALRAFEPQKTEWTGSRRPELQIAPYPVEKFCLETTRLTRLAAGMLLSRRPVCIVGSEQWLDHQTRLSFMDAVAALLPYGFRSSLAVSTWTKTNSPHSMRLSFASVAPDWATELVWSEPDPAAVGDGLGAEYLKVLEGFDDGMLAEVIRQLSLLSTPLSFRRDAELDTALDALTNSVKAANAERRVRSDHTVIDLLRPVMTVRSAPDPDPVLPAAKTAEPVTPEKNVPDPTERSVLDLVTASFQAVGRADVLAMEKVTALLAGRSVKDPIEKAQCQSVICAHAAILGHARIWKEGQKILLREVLLAVYGRPLRAETIPFIGTDFGRASAALWASILPTPGTFMTDAATIVLRFHQGQATGLPLYQVLNALKAEPTDLMFTAVLHDVKAAGITPEDLQDGLEHHGYFSSWLPSARCAVELLENAYGTTLTTDSVTEILRHADQPSLFLLHAIIDRIDRTTTSEQLWPLMRPAIEAAKLSHGDREQLERRITRLDLEPSRAPSRRRTITRTELITVSGWVVAIAASLGLMTSYVLSDDSPPASTPTAAVPTASPVQDDPASVTFSWPSYKNDKRPGSGKAEEAISYWAAHMVPQKCVSLTELNRTQDLSDIYLSLSLACEAATSDNSPARWKAAQDTLTAFNGKRAHDKKLQEQLDGHCLDKLVLALATALIQRHAGEDDGQGAAVTIKPGPAMEVVCPT